MAVVSFGDEVRMLHHFDAPMTDSAGAYVAENFTFRQRNTHWQRLLPSLVEMLDDEREAGGDDWSIVFIITDAQINTNRDTVRRWCRKAREKGYILLLIIMDGNNANDSVLTRQFVSFAGGQVTTTRYIENFPFE